MNACRCHGRGKGRDGHEVRVGRAGFQRSGVSLALKPRGRGPSGRTSRVEARRRCPGSKYFQASHLTHPSFPVPSRLPS